MSTIDTWDWHYRIAFDARLRAQIAGVIEELPFDTASERRALYLPAFLGERYRIRIGASDRLTPRQPMALWAPSARAWIFW